MTDTRGSLAGSLSSPAPPSFSFDFADVALRRGTTPLEPSTVPTLPTGQSFTLEIPTNAIGLLLPAVQKVREAAARRTTLELALRLASGGSGPAARKVSKVEALTVKQKATRSGIAFEITLRKL